MAQNIKRPRGTDDITVADSYLWDKTESILIDTAKLFGFLEMRTPTFEYTELFLRGVGDTTDVVSKEMYTFQDKGDRSLTLKPEGTAGIVRAAIENGLLGDVLPFKASYITPCFRYDKPQAGRYREFHQFGIETLGATSPACDVESISLARNILEKLFLTKINLYINSIGCMECRPNYYVALKQYFSSKKDQLCTTCNERLEKNPMRILDCKCKTCIEIAANAPSVIDYICDECKDHFNLVKKGLQVLKIPYAIDSKIVRGLDYYTKTVFEFVDENNGLTLCGGGRYDGLVEELGGNPITGFGFAIGLERLILAIKNQKVAIEKPKCPDIYIGYMGDDASLKSQELVYLARDNGFYAEGDLTLRSVKAQMKYANKINAQFSTIIGENELASGSSSIKNMKTGVAFTVKFDDFVEFLMKETLENEFEEIIHNNTIGGIF